MYYKKKPVSINIKTENNHEFMHLVLGISSVVQRILR
jgi:hypothetical protein